MVAGVEGRLATKISHRPKNFLNDRASVVEYQSVGRDPSTSPVPGTMYFHQRPSNLFTEDIEGDSRLGQIYVDLMNWRL